MESEVLQFLCDVKDMGKEASLFALDWGEDRGQYHYHLIFLSTKELTPEATTINCKIIPFIMTYESIFFSARIVNIWNSLPNSVVDACTVNAFKARRDKCWQHQLVKFDFTAELTSAGNRSEEVIK